MGYNDNDNDNIRVDFGVLQNKILKDIKVNRSHKVNGYETGDEIIFTSSHNEKWKMYHYPDCCEEVYLEDIIGDINDLIGVPIIMAEKTTNKENPKEETINSVDNDYCTWTFYKLGTTKGYVTIRWYGASNGYYSEEVDFERIVNVAKKI